eukprot:TRINITY_DN10876_c0_g1_i1.p1 TRINITY_DN10876_c0_g1~~TRINITY_DN10876_c0_g1_i1.p1  ORF type:complete len:664 (-),score=114.52 TRINITY_DN10876_c0_g1_i1:70-2061(-)
MQDLQQLNTYEDLLLFKNNLSSQQEDLRVKKDEYSAMLVEKSQSSLIELKQVFESGILQLENDVSVLLSDLDQDITSLDNFKQKIQVAYKKVTELQREQQYLQVLKIIESLSNQVVQTLGNEGSDIQSCIGIASDALKPFYKLLDIRDSLNNYPCDNLKHNIDSKLEDVSHILENELKRVYKLCLEDLGFVVPVRVIQLNDTEKLSNFTKIFKHLIRFQISLDPKMYDMPMLWAVQIMLVPIQDEFKYHFRTKTVLNQLEKPEFFYSYILKLLEDHNQFIVYIQTLVNDCNIPFYDMNAEFIRGLSVEVRDKLEYDLPVLLKSEELYWHTISETLEFEKFIQDIYDYPADFIHPIDVILELTKENWLELEKKYTDERLLEIMKDENAWSLQYKEFSSDTNPTRCVYRFLELIESVTSRYLYIPSNEIRYEFLERIQFPLLDVFYKELNEIFQFNVNLRSNSASNYNLSCSILNSVHYCYKILNEWNEKPIYIEMKMEKDRNFKITKYEREFDVEESLFDKYTNLFSQFYQKMIEDIVDNIIDGFSEVSKPYIKSRKIYATSKKSTRVSPELVDSLSLVRAHMNIEKILDPDIFYLFRSTLAEELDHYIFKQFVQGQNFTHSSALQLQIDIQAVLQIFGKSSKAQNFFPRVSESLKSLTLSEGL